MALANITVLIADDVKLFLEIEKSYLMRGGFDVLTAASGKAAVALARERQPALVLLDLEMPEMDGAAACAAMRQVPELAQTPIIIMSATDTPQARERCRKAGCTEFVVKPEKPEELLGVVARTLAIRQRQAARITVVFDVAGSPGEPQIVGRARNLSVQGMLLETPGPLKAGSMLHLEFYLPRLLWQVKVKGKVLRAAKGADGAHEAGIQFIDLSPTDQEQILDFVSA
jgi:CheY-like chemotaxis protein